MRSDYLEFPNQSSKTPNVSASACSVKAHNKCLERDGSLITDSYSILINSADASDLRVFGRKGSLALDLRSFDTELNVVSLTIGVSTFPQARSDDDLHCLLRRCRNAASVAVLVTMFVVHGSFIEIKQATGTSSIQSSIDK